MEFQAKWIWVEPHLSRPNNYIYARREFTATPGQCADAFVSCTGEYKLYVNGRCVGRGANYGQTYNTHDLCHIIRSGKNVIAALCYNPATNQSEAPIAGFLLQLDILHNGSEPQQLCTDESWHVHLSEEWCSDSVAVQAPERYQEIYDSRSKPVGWNVVGFDDGDWPSATVQTAFEARLKPRQIPPLREREVHPKLILECGTVVASEAVSSDIAQLVYSEQTNPEAGAVKYAREMLTPTGDAAVVSPGADSYVILDFGAEMVGYPSIRIRGGGEALVDIAYGEALDDTGRVWTTRNDGHHQADRVILHGGRQDWQAFGRRELRYIQLAFRNLKTPLSIESVSVVTVGYPVEQASTFECSDELLTTIWQRGVYTLGLCMQDKYESPVGSGRQVAGDAQRQALINYYCFLDSALAAQALEQIPEYEDLERDGLAWAIMLYDYYVHTADMGLVQQLYPRLDALLGDPSSVSPEMRGMLTHRCQALGAASKLAAAVHKTEDAARWHEEAASIRRTFNEVFWNEQTSSYFAVAADSRNGEQLLSNLCAVSCGLADSARADAIWRAYGGERLDSWHDPTAMFAVLQGLSRIDRIKEALNLIRSYWGAMLDLGATTWWEWFTRDHVDTEGVSLCHGPSAAPTYFLPAEILGVKPSSPGHVVIQPRVGDLEWAKGHIMTVSGYVDVEWHVENRMFRIDIQAPPEFIVALPIGGFEDPVIDEIDLTPETPERRARKTYGWGNTIWRGGTEHDPYLDWLESQSTEPPADYNHRERCAADGSYVWVRESISNHVRYEIREA